MPSSKQKEPYPYVHRCPVCGIPYTGRYEVKRPDGTIVWEERSIHHDHAYDR